MKQFKLLIAFIFLFTQNVYTYEGFDDFGNPTESAASSDGTPKCSKTIEEVSSELSLIQVGSEKDITKLNAAQRKASELSGVASCLSVESDAGKALKADIDSASTNINNQINIVYNLVVDEEKEKSKSEATGDSVREAKKITDIKPSETLPSKALSAQPQPITTTPTSGSASVPVAVAPDAAPKKTDLQLSTSSPSETQNVVPAKPVAGSTFEPSAVTKDSSTQMGPPAPAGSAVKDGQTILPKEDSPPLVKEKPTIAADPTKKIADVPSVPAPAKPAASSDINIGAIAKIGLMAAAAWIYVKELTKGFKKKDEDTSASRSTASSGSGSSSSSNPSGTKAVAGGKGCTGTFVGTIDAPSHAERIKARNIKLNNMGYQLTGNDYEDNGATGGGGVDGGMYLTGSFSFETDANCKVISGQAIIFGHPFDISGTVNQNRTFNLSYLGPMLGVITADNKISGKLQHGGGEEYIHGVLNGRFTPKK